MKINDWPRRRYGAILADPPWQFSSWSPAGDGRNANRHYECLSLEAIKALSVASLARREVWQRASRGPPTPPQLSRAKIGRFRHPC